MGLIRTPNLFIRRGISGTEVVITMALIVIVAVVLAVVFNRTSEARQASRCQFNLHSLSDAVESWSAEHDDRFPLPGGETMDNDAGSFQLSNASADLHLLLLMGKYDTPDDVICPGEANPVVNVFTGDLSELTAGDFRADIDADPGRSWSNISYANQDSARIRPTATLAEEMLPTPANNVWFSDRGPENGIPDPSSYSYQLHGPEDQWVGYFALADGHVIGYTEDPRTSVDFAPEDFTWGDAAEPDNLFKPESSAIPPLDEFLAIFRLNTTGDSLEPVWD